MIRLFKSTTRVRTLVLLVGEALIVWSSFLLGMVLQNRENLYNALNYEGGYLKILVVTLIVLVFSHWFDLYDPTHFSEKARTLFPVGAGAGHPGSDAGGHSGICFPAFCPATTPRSLGL